LFDEQSLFILSNYSRRSVFDNVPQPNNPPNAAQNNAAPAAAEPPAPRPNLNNIQGFMQHYGEQIFPNRASTSSSQQNVALTAMSPVTLTPLGPVETLFPHSKSN
jgi:hypothetical protein